jgi:anti-sigma-K factor RskA
MSEEHYSNESTSAAGADHTPPTGYCQQVEEAIPAYAIGASDPEEAALVQAGLATCPELVHTLADYAALAEALHTTAPPVIPPAHLEERLRAALHQPIAAPRASRPLARPPVRQRLGWRWSATWAAAAVTALLLLLALNLYAIRQNLELRGQIEALRQQQLASDLQKNALYLFRGSGERQTILLPAAQENSNATAEVLWEPGVGVALLYANAFPPLEADQVYQLWLTRAGEPQSGGLFTVDTSGSGLLIFPVNQPLDTLDSMGITPEPAGGSPGPTAPPVVRHQFQSS